LPLVCRATILDLMNEVTRILSALEEAQAMIEFDAAPTAATTPDGK
jgi:hypothetical protein